MENPIYVLIAAQDAAMIRELAVRLKSWGYTPVLVRNPELLMKSINSSIRIILIGSQFYEKTGKEWIREIRRFSTIPVFILGSSNDQDVLEEAIEAGADDYMKAPLDLEHLRIRISALLRRTYEYASEKDVPIGRGLSYSSETGTLRYNGEIIDLTRTEQKIMDILAQNKGRAVSREVLMEALWQTSEYICDGTLSTSISRLRSKLKQISMQKVIQTRKGVGYIIP